MKRSSLFKEYLEELDREESPKNQISRYLLGLTPELKKMVSQQKPHTLNAAIHYAEESQDILKDIEKSKPTNPWINIIEHPTPVKRSYYRPYRFNEFKPGFHYKNKFFRNKKPFKRYNPNFTPIGNRYMHFSRSSSNLNNKLSYNNNNSSFSYIDSSVSCMVTYRDRYYVSLLLGVVESPKSFDNLKCSYETYEAACNAKGLIGNDDEYIQCVRNIRCTPASLRSFVNMLLNNNCIVDPSKFITEVHFHLTPN
ncbi:hypothetical protein DAPK24_034160 [Pichia kluyveri]|uniref:Uncharacterized protein n=1 Tax=Pichia kluyveri TaxID=36015 RepID=A0AAV5R8A9_PICKL|nr:hypothetical protein DAPK24_034160 [Pichia kluyveri]